MPSLYEWEIGSARWQRRRRRQNVKLRRVDDQRPHADAHRMTSLWVSKNWAPRDRVETISKAAQNDVERRWDRRQIQQQQTAHNVRERVRQTGNYLPLPRGRVLLPKLFDTPPTPPPTGECEEFLHVISQKATTVAKIRQLNYCLLY